MNFSIEGHFELCGNSRFVKRGLYEIKSVDCCTATLGEIGNSREIDLSKFRNDSGDTLLEVMHHDFYYFIKSALAKQVKEVER